MNHSITPLVTEAERVLKEAISYFNLTVCPEQLTVTIQTQGRTKAAGWFAWDRWSDVKKTIELPGLPESRIESINMPRHEINLSAECLHDNDMGMVLLHELAHAENWTNQDLDHDKATRKKHNLVFKAMAERLGLDCQEKDKKVHWGNTVLGSEGRKFLESINFNRSLFELFRLPPEQKEKQTTRMVKLECPNDECKYIIRTTKGNVEKGIPTCHCGEVFVPEVKEEEEND